MAARSVTDICNMALLYAGVNLRIGSLLEPSAEAQACNTIYDEHRRNMMSDLHWPFALRRKQLFPYSGVAYDAARTYAKDDLAQYGQNVYRSLQGGNTARTPSDDASAAWWAQVTRDGYSFCCPLPDDCLDPIEVWPKLDVSPTSVPTATLYVANTGYSLRNPRSSERAPFRLENANDGTDLEVLLTDIQHPILLFTADVTNPAVLPTEFVEALAWDLAGPLARGLRSDEKKGDSCDKKAEIKKREAFVISMRDQREDQEPENEFTASREGCP